MKATLRALTLLMILGLTAACATGARPAWTYPPASPSGAPSTAPSGVPASPQPSGQPSGQPVATPTANPAGSDDVLPVLTPKAQLAAVPAGEVNVAYAPTVPAAATRTNQAIVEVHFDVVEGVQAIDPNGIEYTTWGYRLHGDDTVR